MYEYAELKAFDWRSTVASSDITRRCSAFSPPSRALLLSLRVQLVAHALWAIRPDQLVLAQREGLREPVLLAHGSKPPISSEKFGVLYAASPGD